MSGYNLPPGVGVHDIPGNEHPKAKRPRPRKTPEQQQASRFLELYGIVHFLLTEQKCPVIFNGKLAFVRCPGVSKKAFKQAIHNKVVRNLVAYCAHPKP